MYTKRKNIYLTEEDKAHVNLLCWRTNLLEISKKLGMHQGTLSCAMRDGCGLSPERLAALRALTKEDFPKAKKAKPKGTLGDAKVALISGKGKAPENIKPYKRSHND